MDEVPEINTEPSSNNLEEKNAEKTDKERKETEDKKESLPTKIKVTQKKPVDKDVKQKKKEKHREDFSYIVRIANTDIDGEKNLIHGLTAIKGIGLHMSALIVKQTSLHADMKIGDLKEGQIEKIRNVLEDLDKISPKWMLNHQKNLETGTDMHLIGSDIDMKLRDEINIMKKIRCYRGIRHETGLPVRGQRTKANGRRGLSLGVSKKRE